MTHHQSGSTYGRNLAQGLGWFSLALGAAELFAGERLARALGLGERADLIRAYGLREVGTGVGILLADDPTPWIWGRVAGDALDLATLAGALDRDNPQRANAGIAVAAVAGVTVLDLICTRQLAAEREEEEWRVRRAVRDYSARSGLPQAPDAMRGAARDLDVPSDMRIPEALRPYATA